MANLVEPIYGVDLETALAYVQQAHRILVCGANEAVQSLGSAAAESWGSEAKRLMVELEREGAVPVGKHREKFTEVINMAATIERLMDCLDWLHSQESYMNLTVRECHPSTSDGENDVVLCTSNGEVRVRCEVCDVVSSNAGSNSKEAKDLRNLGCGKQVPDDGVDRYIATSIEFARALTSESRKWKDKHYRYSFISMAKSQTVLLKLEASERVLTPS